MASLTELVALLALSFAIAGRWGEILFLFLYPIWCGLWEAKIRSRPLHWLLGWRLAPFGRFTATRLLVRGLLRMLVPFLHAGWHRVTLFDRCTRCRWTVRPPRQSPFRPHSEPSPAGYR
ncbi:MAG: hypothetical protein AB7T14_09415 [Candidatus Methylacidiphilaceae bacterium]